MVNRGRPGRTRVNKISYDAIMNDDELTDCISPCRAWVPLIHDPLKTFVIDGKESGYGGVRSAV